MTGPPVPGICRAATKVRPAAVDHRGVELAAATMGAGRPDAVTSQASAALLRTALDQQLQSSAALLEVLPQPQPLTPAPSLEAHLGGRIDLYG